MKKEVDLKTVARINSVKIQIVENGDKLVPIKPICEALGIDFKSQYEKIKLDDFLSSTMVLSTIVAADGKEREMTSLPYKYIFGWLFTINPKNVKPEAKDAVMKYRMECYDVLYDHFTETSDFLEEKQSLVDKELDEYQIIQEQFKTAKGRLADQKKRVDIARKMTITYWKENHKQLVIDFDKPKE